MGCTGDEGHESEEGGCRSASNEGHEGKEGGCSPSDEGHEGKKGGSGSAGDEGHEGKEGGCSAGQEGHEGVRRSTVCQWQFQCACRPTCFRSQASGVLGAAGPNRPPSLGGAVGVRS